MRTPTAMIVGLVLCHCGLLLTLTGTLAPNWRQVSLIPDQPIDLVTEQGIWDICTERQSSHSRLCGQADELGYFKQVPVQVAQGMMPSSLVLTLVGLLVAALGVRCWQEEPRHTLAGVAGLVLLLSGLLSLVPASWYTHELWALPAPAGSTLVVGYSLVLSYLGSCFEILGGAGPRPQLSPLLQEPQHRDSSGHSACPALREALAPALSKPCPSLGVPQSRLETRPRTSLESLQPQKVATSPAVLQVPQLCQSRAGLGISPGCSPSMQLSAHPPALCSSLGKGSPSVPT
uniref:Claudin 23 n=1 Tax=Amazona collaria TaxID=241587 RepID=A0A8B9F8I3_9PSIT